MSLNVTVLLVLSFIFSLSLLYRKGMSLSEREIESVGAELEPLGIRIGALLGTGSNSATYALKGKDDNVVKVVRTALDARVLEDLDGLVPAVHWRQPVGLLSVYVMDRVTPGDSPSLDLRVYNGTDCVDQLEHLDGFQADAVHKLFQDLAAKGYVHMDPHLGNLGWTAAKRPIVMDFASCTKRDLSAQDQRWATAFQLGLFLERTPPAKLSRNALFQQFCLYVFGKRMFAKAKRNLREWAIAEASKHAPEDSPNFDLYVGCFLLAAYLPQGCVDRNKGSGPELVADIQQHKALWLNDRRKNALTK